MNGATTASDFNVSEHTFILTQNEVVELRIHGSNHGTLSLSLVSIPQFYLRRRNHPPFPSSVSWRVPSRFLELIDLEKFSGHAFDVVQSASGPVNYVNP
jgi:hypothetical protein